MIFSCSCLVFSCQKEGAKKTIISTICGVPLLKAFYIFQLNNQNLIYNNVINGHGNLLIKLKYNTIKNFFFFFHIKP